MALQTSGSDKPGTSKEQPAENAFDADKKKQKGKGFRGQAIESTSGAWLVSFTDVMALMLTFFVLLFSMSDPDKETWDGVTAALKTEFQSSYGGQFNKGLEQGPSVLRFEYDDALDVGYLQNVIDRDINENKTLEGIYLSDNGSNLQINFPFKSFFEDGSRELSDEGRRQLYVLAPILSRIKNRLEIHAYVPGQVSSIDGADKSTIWGNSLDYAVGLASVLDNVGYERNIVVSGFAVPLLEENTDSPQIQIIISNHAGEKRTFQPDLIFE